jgi:hypothetical protein
MSRNPTRRSIADKSLTALVSFCAIALGPIAASAMSLTNTTARITPMTHPAWVNNLGGGLNSHIDYTGGQGGHVGHANDWNLTHHPKRCRPANSVVGSNCHH